MTPTRAEILRIAHKHRKPTPPELREKIKAKRERKK